MQTKILDYKITIEKEIDEKGKAVYNASCPVLGLYDWGDTTDEAIRNITELIKFHIESLKKFNYEIPVEKDDETTISSVKIPVSSYQNFAYLRVPCTQS